MPNWVDALKTRGYFEMLEGSFAVIAAIEIDSDIVSVCEKRKEKQPTTTTTNIFSVLVQTTGDWRLFSRLLCFSVRPLCWMINATGPGLK